MKNSAERTFSSTDDDDDIEVRPRAEKKEQPKPIHHLPGISLETKQEDRKPEKRLSLSQVFEKMGTKPMIGPKEESEQPAEVFDRAKDEKAEKDTPNEHEEFEDSVPELENSHPDVAYSDYSIEKEDESAHEDTAESHKTEYNGLVVADEVDTKETIPSADAFEAADWETEAEIPLKNIPEAHFETKEPTPEVTDDVKMKIETAELTPELPVVSKDAEPPIEPLPPEGSDHEEETPVEEDPFTPDLGREGPPRPPEPPDGGGGEDEPPDPSGPDGHGYATRTAARTAGRTWYSAAATDRERIDHERELNDTAYYAEKRGLRRGLLTGGLVGWSFGRRGKKKQVKEFTKQIKNKEKDIKNLEDEQFYTNERIKALQRTHEQQLNITAQERPKAADSPENSPEQAPKPVEALNKKQKATERPPILKELPNTPLTEKAKRFSDFMPIASVIEKNNSLKNIAKPIAEKAPRPQMQELLKSAAVAEAAAEAIRSVTERPGSDEALKPNATSELRRELESKLAGKELPPEDREIVKEIYEEPEGSKVEVSAWHRIEIDKRTGKAVENPDVAYGEEFQHEQQEVLHDNKKRRGGSNQTQQGGNTGGGAASRLGGFAASSFSAAAAASETGGPEPSQSTAAPSLKQNLPMTSIEDEHLKHLSAGSELLRHASSPVIWTVAIVIVLILFLIGVLR